MKFRLLFSLLICICFRASAQFDSIVVSWNYNYSDYNGTPYALQDRTEEHFDSVKHVTKYITDTWNGYRFAHSYRNVYTYNSAGNIIETLSQNYGINSWNNTSRQYTHYNSFNQIDTVLNQNWQNNNWVNTNTVYYSYNINHYLIFKWTYDQYFYYPDANGNDTLIVEKNYNGSTYVNYRETRNSYNLTNQKIYELNYNYLTAGSNWAKSDSSSYSYYLNDSLFITRSYRIISDTIVNFSGSDSLVYSGDTLFTYMGTQYNPGDSIIYDQRSITYYNGLVYYNSLYEYFDGSSWNMSDYNISSYDSTTNILHQQGSETGSNYINNFIYDSDGHLVSSHSSGTTHSGYYSYGDKYYYYYLTNGSDGNCPGMDDSLWITPGMNSYLWNTGSTNNNILINQAGQYNCHLVNQYGHPFDSEPLNVSNSILPTATRGADSTFFVCRSNTSFILSEPDIPFYEYQWLRNDSILSGQNSPIIYPTIAGAYQVIVSNQCGVDSSAITHLQFSRPAVRITPSGTIYICPGSTVQLTADSGFVSYLWNLGDTTRQIISHYGNSENAVTAVDNTGCTSSFGINIIDDFLSSSFPLRISQVHDSILSSNFSNGNFQWYRNGIIIPGATSYQLTISQSGFYKYSYSDGTCQVFSTERYFNFSSFRIVFTGDTFLTCSGHVYEMSVNSFHVSGGIAPFHYQWSPSTGLSNALIEYPQITNSSIQQYILTVTDSTGATATDTIVLHPNAPVNFTISSSKNSVCAILNGNNYWDTLSIPNLGQGFYVWTFNGNALNTPGTNIVKYIYQPGTYSAYFNNGCQNYSDTITIGTFPMVPRPIIHPETIPLNWCATDSIRLVADLVNPASYQISWLQWNPYTILSSIEDTITVYSGGTYSIRYTDMNGCEDFSSFDFATILPDSEVNFSLSPHGLVLGCLGDSVKLQSTSYPGWNYHWNNFSNELVSNGNNYDAIYSGNYIVKVDNGFGCHGEDSALISFGHYGTNVSLTYNGSLIRAITNDYIVIWKWYYNNTLINGADSNQVHPVSIGWYKVIANMGTSCGPATDSIYISCTLNTSVVAPTCHNSCDASVSVTPVASGMFSFTWSTGDTINHLSNICEGNYIVHADNHIGCSLIDTINISGPAHLSTLSVVQPESCFQSCNGSIVTLVSGGTFPYTYSWTGGSSNPDINGLCAGNYQLVVTDNHGCKDTSDFTVSGAQPDSIHFILNNSSCISCDDGSIQASAGGGSPPYLINWSTGDTTLTILNLPPGSYVACITNSHSCVLCDTVTLGFSTNIFSPSDDGVKIFPNPFDNSTTVLISSSILNSASSVIMYDDFGKLIFNKKFYEKQFTIYGKELTEGIYYLEIVNENGNVIVRKNLTVMH